ncbi:MAG: phytanoyl-CoA dioxygenase family protein, partial [Actinomycetota bacterium]
SKVLQDWGLTKPYQRESEASQGPRWSGEPVGVRDTVDLEGVPAILSLIEGFSDPHHPLRQVVDRVCGHAMHLWRGTSFFVGYPDDAAYATKPHQDGWAPWTGDYRRVWIAITHIPFGDGGLALAPGSHRLGALPYRDMPELKARPDPATGVTPKVQGIDPGLVDDRWYTAEMHPGDAFVFSHDVVHRGLPFSSERIRLALVAMASAESDPRPEVTYTKVELRERTRQLWPLIDGLGLSDDEVRAVRGYLYGSPQPVTRAMVDAALAPSEAAHRRPL